jgi:hypothetical protein
MVRLGAKAVGQRWAETAGKIFGVRLLTIGNPARLYGYIDLLLHLSGADLIRASLFCAEMFLASDVWRLRL